MNYGKKLWWNQAVPEPANYVAYYPFASNANDFSGNNLNGNFYGIAAIVNNSAYFPFGSGSRSQVNDNNLLSFLSGFTATFEIKPSWSSGTTIYSIFSKSDNDTQREYIIYFYNSRFYIHIYSQSSSSNYILYSAEYSSLGIDNTKFHSVKLSFNGTGGSSGAKLFVNNVEKALLFEQTGTFSGMTNTSAPLTIGGVNWSTNFNLQGYLKELKLYNYVW